MADIVELLPGYNCGKCGYPQCRDFASHIKDATDLMNCPYLTHQRFHEQLEKLRQMLQDEKEPTELPVIQGVIDGLAAEFALGPLVGEKSCREDVHSFDSALDIKKGDVIRYRPLGCPIIHFAEVIEMSHGIATVHIIGPRQRMEDRDFSYKDAGICMILAFEGRIMRGNVPKVGQTVRFLPEHCMMQKIHSGVVVGVEGKNIRIEIIDLKVW